MRRDAAANRERLLAAGRRVLQEQGGSAPVELICEVAGVTRATFYRHFPDRTRLHLAVLDIELAEMAQILAHPATGPLAFLRLLADMMIIYDRYVGELPELPDFAEVEEAAGRMLAVIGPCLSRAQVLGLIREDVTGNDVLVGCRMVGSDWRLDRMPSRAAAVERRLALIVRGLLKPDMSPLDQRDLMVVACATDRE